MILQEPPETSPGPPAVPRPQPWSRKTGLTTFISVENNPVSNRKNIAVAVPTNPEGPYTAEQNPMITGNEGIHADQAIDPYAFRDPISGKYYLIWGNGHALLAEVSPNMLTIISSTLKSLPGLTNYNEAPFVTCRKGLYHFTYAINDTRSEYYATGYAKSTNISASYTYRYPILQLNATLDILGTGGNTLVNVPGSDRWYIAYHRFQILGGNRTMRKTCIESVEFDGETGLIKKVVPTPEGVEGEIVPIR